jgi:carotenoid cleavage dioxygenase
MPFAIAPDTLASEGYWDFAGKVTIGRFTAHPKIDPVTGEMVFFGYGIGGLFTKTIAYGTIDKAGVLTRIDTFEAPYSAMVHDFLVTRNYILFPILPLTASLERAQRGAPAFAWEPEKGGYVGIVRRDSPATTIRWFHVDPRYVYHGMNAYEDGERIVAHVMEYEAPPLFGDVTGKPSDPAKTVSRLTEWTFDLSATGTAFKRKPLDDLFGDFPRLDERYALGRYRHGYFAAKRAAGGAGAFDILVHHDFTTGRQASFSLPAGDAFSEPVFVARHATAEEGDGYLLATIYRASERRSDLAIFEASAIEKGPIGIAGLAHHVPLGFHGNWRGAL